jgi:hypothetical protein
MDAGQRVYCVYLRYSLLGNSGAMSEAFVRHALEALAPLNRVLERMNEIELAGALEYNAAMVTRDEARAVMKEAARRLRGEKRSVI